MNAERLDDLLARLSGIKAAVLGDFCLDIYWFVDPSRAEPSLETGLLTQPVREQRYTLGGAGNVAANLAALGCGRIRALGVLGDDPWGREQTRLLAELGADTSGLVVQEQGWATLAYAKPHVDREEGRRLDFGGLSDLPAAAESALLDQVRRAAREADVVMVNQQVRGGIHTARVRAGLAALMREFPAVLWIADSRHYSEDYPGAVLKVNDHEAARVCGLPRGPDDRAVREELIETLFARRGRPVVLTRGGRGLLARDVAGLHEIPGIQARGPVDPVGAGDSVLAGLALGLAAGGSLEEAAHLGNLVAAVTVRKLRQTGTATPDEVRAIAREGRLASRP